MVKNYSTDRTVFTYINPVSSLRRGAQKQPTPLLIFQNEIPSQASLTAQKNMGDSRTAISSPTLLLIHHPLQQAPLSLRALATASLSLKHHPKDGVRKEEKEEEMIFLLV